MASPDLHFNPQLQFAKLEPEPPQPASRGLDQPGLQGPVMPPGFFSAFTGDPLREQDFADAAETLGCEVAAVKAVAEVETAGAGFDVRGRPRILYERHVFARNTVPRHRFDAAYPELSSRTPGGYGKFSEQYGKLARAFQLDPEAALKAASWGKFQILGENYAACGFPAVADFVRAMTVSEREHLKGFVRFVASSAPRLQAIRANDWARFAYHYNGARYAENQYDTKLAAAYARHAAAAMPG